jgi:hypothetical protein
MLRAGVGFAVLMKLLGHTSPEMTIRDLDVALTDLQREFEVARSRPRHLVPRPKTSFTPRAGLDGLIDSLILCSPLNIYSRCFAERCQTALLAVASTVSPIGVPKSLPKRASSRRPENGQRWPLKPTTRPERLAKPTSF